MSTPFQVDHAIARKHHGRTTLDNLAYSCLHCNARKGPNVGGIDPETEILTPLYNPRRDRWEQHFRWTGAVLVGLTAVGRVTVDVLAINHPEKLKARESMVEERSPGDEG